MLSLVASRQSPAQTEIIKAKMVIKREKKMMLWEAACAACRRGDVPEMLGTRSGAAYAAQ